jgi:hypothetical protein
VKKSLVDRLGCAISGIYAHLDIPVMSVFNSSECLELIKEMRREYDNCSAGASCLRCKAWPRRLACQEAFVGARPRSLCARPRATRPFACSTRSMASRCGRH